MSQFEDVYVLNRGVLVNKYQAKQDDSLNQLITLQCLPAPATSALTSTAQFYFDVNTEDLQLVNDMRLRLDVTESGGSNSMILCPSTYMIQKIEWQDRTGNVFWRSYNDTMFFEACTTVDLAKQNSAYLQSLNVNDKYYEGFVHPANQMRSYRIPMVSHPFSIVESFVGNLQKLRIVIYWGGSVVVSGTGTPSLTNVYLEMNQRKLNKDVLAIQRNHFKTKKITRVCYPDQITLSGQTLTAASTSNFDLSAFKGKYPFFIFGIRAANNSATDSAYLKTLALGPKGSVDILTPTGQSMWSNGTAPKIHLISETQTDAFSNKTFTDQRRWYMLSFCNNPKQALAGMENGYLNLNGSKYQLAITPDAAKVDTVQTITLTSATAQTQGAFLLSFKGNNTAPIPYNQTVGNIATQLNALPEFKNYPGGPLIATVGTTFAAGGSVAVTLNAQGAAPPNQASDLISFNNINCAVTTTAASVDSATTAVSTNGVAGWTTGSSYIIDIYGYKQRWMTECEGKVTVVDDL